MDGIIGMFREYNWDNKWGMWYSGGEIAGTAAVDSHCFRWQARFIQVDMSNWNFHPGSRLRHRKINPQLAIRGCLNIEYWRTPYDAWGDHFLSKVAIHLSGVHFDTNPMENPQLLLGEICNFQFLKSLLFILNFLLYHHLRCLHHHHFFP